MQLFEFKQPGNGNTKMSGYTHIDQQKSNGPPEPENKTIFINCRVS